MTSEHSFCPVGARRRVLSRHRTSEGEVRYLRCECGVIELVVDGVPRASVEVRR